MLLFRGTPIKLVNHPYESREHMIPRANSVETYQPGIDHYLRVRASELKELALHLHWMELPVDSSDPTLGYTEWAGRYKARVVSVGCFWRMVGQGKALTAEVSTNLMVVDSKGYDIGDSATSEALLPLIQRWLLNDEGALVDQQIQLLAASGGRLQ